MEGKREWRGEKEGEERRGVCKREERRRGGKDGG